jgi:hypothetical protein
MGFSDDLANEATEPDPNAWDPRIVEFLDNWFAEMGITDHPEVELREGEGEVDDFSEGGASIKTHVHWKIWEWHYDGYNYQASGIWPTRVIVETSQGWLPATTRAELARALKRDRG